MPTNQAIDPLAIRFDKPNVIPGPPGEEYTPEIIDRYWPDSPDQAQPVRPVQPAQPGGYVPSIQNAIPVTPGPSLSHYGKSNQGVGKCFRRKEHHGRIPTRRFQ